MVVSGISCCLSSTLLKAKKANEVTRPSPNSGASFYSKSELDGERSMANGTATGAEVTEAGDGLLYFNGIDAESGNYMFPPLPIEEIVARVLKKPQIDDFAELHADVPRSFGLTFAVDP